MTLFVDPTVPILSTGKPLLGNLYAHAVTESDPATVGQITAPETVEEALRLDPAFIYAKVEA